MRECCVLGWPAGRVGGRGVWRIGDWMIVLIMLRYFLIIKRREVFYAQHNE